MISACRWSVNLLSLANRIYFLALFSVNLKVSITLNWSPLGLLLKSSLISSITRTLLPTDLLKSCNSLLLNTIPVENLLLPINRVSSTVISKSNTQFVSTTLEKSAIETKSPWSWEVEIPVYERSWDSIDISLNLFHPTRWLSLSTSSSQIFSVTVLWIA